MAEQRERIGQIVGEYRLLRKLGGGSFGHVYLAEHIRDSNQVALKLLQVYLSTKEDLRAFLNEARTMRLRHPHIVPLLDFGLSHEDMPFLVMEYAPSGTLRNRHPKGSHVPLQTVVTYATQIASALQYAHNTHVIHRDVKPENMLLRNEHIIQLSDFGIATTAHSTRSVMTNAGVGGTVPYMAPEQLDGQPRPASDQYALGIVVYEWLAGSCPFQGTAVEVTMQHALKPPPSLMNQVSGLPIEVEEVVFKALAKDPKERFASVQAFANALQQATIHKLVPTASSEEALAPTIPPALSSPLPVAPPPSTVQELVIQSVPPITETLDLREAKPPAPLFSNTAPKTIETKVSAPPKRKGALSKGYVVLLVVMALLLIGGGVYAYSAVNTSMNATKIYAQATALAPTAQAAKSAYTAHVAEDGSMFGFDAQHTHYNPYERILNSTNVSSVQEAWAAPTGDQIQSSPAVVNGLVYVGSEDGKLYAFDALTGKQIWAAPTHNSIDVSSPVVANGLVYVGSEDHLLYAFDALTGKQKWAAHTGGAIDSSPAVVNGLVYIGSADHQFYAFDALTGRQIWAAHTGGAIGSSPAVARSMIYVGSADHQFYAFDALTGRQIWAAHTGGAIDSSPAVVNGLVYIGSEDGKLYAFDALTGRQIWAAPTDEQVHSSPAVANGLVYVGSYNSKLYIFDALTGKQKWAASTGAAIYSSPTVANGLVYIGSEDGKLYIFDALTGQQIWVTIIGNSVVSSPAVANGFVYIGSDDSKLYAFSLFGKKP